MTKALWFLVAAMATVACGNTGESDEPSTGTTEGAIVQRCGRGGRAVVREPSLSSLLDEVETLKLATAARDPGALPTGARNQKYVSSLELHQDGKFKAKLNNGTRLKGTYQIMAPRCMSNYEIISLDPAGEEAEGITFKVFRGKGADFELPTRTYGFIGEGFTPFNMKVDGWEEPAAEEQSCNCDDLPRPRCMGAYVCEDNACVWRSPVGGARCGG